MKKFLVIFRDIELVVYADTESKARKKALQHFIALLEKDLQVIAATQQCDICQYTYPPSHVVKRDGEQLCRSCDADKYPLHPEDIPF